MNVTHQNSQCVDNEYTHVCLGLADVMVQPLERREYLYELRGVSENIVQERLEQLQVRSRNMWPETFERGKVQESANVGVLDASEVEQAPPHSPNATMDSTSTPDDSQAIPAFHIPMTQGKSLEELPSQLDFEWTESVAPNPMPVVDAASVVPPHDPELNSFVMVSQIASEAVKNASEDLPQQET